MLDPGRISTHSYSGFISYCRRDAAHARWLQQALESYRLPARLVGTPTPHGPVPRRLAPVFLDRSDLTVGPDLAGEIAQAINASRFLIVLCTPNAARSEWVMREIGMMQQAGRADHILATLFEGDEHDAFPPALGGGEGGGTIPLAADFRPGGDGRRLALLKLVAVLAGVSLGDLVHRDEARRRRHLSGIAAGALAGMVLFAGITAYALSAKSEAEAERAKSEALVESLITDLRTAVKPLGSLAILAQINEAAGRYYRGQSLADMDDAALAQRARLLIAMGEDEMARNQPKLAQVHYAEAHRTISQRLQTDPASAQRLFDLGQAEFGLGYAAFQSGDMQAATVHMGRYADNAQQLVRRQPRNPVWQNEAGYAALNLGVLALRQRADGPAAEPLFRSALAHHRAAELARPRDPSIAPAIANALGWLADALRVQGRFAEARGYRLEQLELAETRLRSEPQNRQLLRERLVARFALARIAADAGRVDVARRMFEPLGREADRLARSDPEDREAAGQARMVRLFAARTALIGSAPADPAALEAAIGECGSPALSGDIAEVRRFCTLVRARLHLANGQHAEARALGATARAPVSAPRLSERWGIDFDAEIAAVTRATDRPARRNTVGREGGNA